MEKPKKTPAIIIASDLKTGKRVFWSNGAWVDFVEESEIFQNQEPLNSAYNKALFDVANNIVLEVEIIEIDSQSPPANIGYIHNRIKIIGPTIAFGAKIEGRENV